MSTAENNFYVPSQCRAEPFPRLIFNNGQSHVFARTVLNNEYKQIAVPFPVTDTPVPFETLADSIAKYLISGERPCVNYVHFDGNVKRERYTWDGKALRQIMPQPEAYL